MSNAPRFEVFSFRQQPESDPEYGWRFRAANGQISAIGGEGFTRKADARRAVEDLLADLALALYEVRGGMIEEVDA